MKTRLPDSKYAKLIKTIFISGGAFFLNCAINLVLPPYITGHVGTEAYGFVLLARNFVQYAVIVTTALNSFSARHITVEYHQNRKQEANVFFSSTFYGDLFLGTGLLLILLLCIAFLEKLLQIPSTLVPDVKLLFLIVSINFFLTTLFTVFGTSAYITNKLDIVSTFKALSYVVEAAVLVLLYTFLPAKVFYIGFGLLLQSFILILANLLIHKKYTPDLVIRRAFYSLTAVKRLVVDGIWTSLNTLGETLNTGLDLLVCNLLLTPLDMGHLGIAKTVSSIFSSLFVLIGQAFQPIFLKSYAQGDIKTLLKELKFSMKLSGMFSNIAYAGFLILGMVFYNLWIPTQNIELVYQLSVIENMLVIGTGIMFPLYYIYFLTVKKKFPTIITIIGGFINVISMYILIRYIGLGVHVVVLTTTVIMFVINFVTNPLYMAHVLNAPWTTFYPNIGRNILSLAVITLAYKGLSMLYMPSSWLSLAFCAAVYAMVGAVLHIAVAFNWEEKTRILGLVLSKLRHV